MKTKILNSTFLILSCIILSCNNAVETKADSATTDTASSTVLDTASVQQFPTTAAAAPALDESMVEFQNKLDISLTEVNTTKDLIADTLSAISDQVAKKNLLKTKLNLTYLANTLVSAKVNYLVTDMEKINAKFGSQINEASASFAKISHIAARLTSINKGITQLVKIGKILITKGLVKI